MSRALKPGGRFLLDTSMAGESFIANYQERRWYDVDDLLFLIKNEYDHTESRLKTELTFVQGGKTEKRWFSQRVFLYRELADLLSGAGFRDLRALSGSDGQPYRLGSPGLLLVASR